MGDAGYGLRIAGEKEEQQLTIGLNQDGLTIHGGANSATTASLVNNKSGGWSLSFGSGKSNLVVDMSGEDGLSVVHSVDNAKLLSVKLGGGGATALQVHHPIEKDSSVGFSLIADDKGASFDLLRNGGSAAQFAAGPNGLAYLLLGARQLGLYMQATAAGNILLEMCNELPRLVIQSTATGTGMGINRKNGSTVLRLGLTGAEELVRKLWTHKGEPLRWDPKDSDK